MELWSRCGAGVLLAGSLLQDVRRGTISVKWLIFSALCALFMAYLEEMRLLSLVLGLVPGAVLAAAAVVTQGRIGRGDAGVVLVLGMYLGLWGCMGALLLGCALSALCGAGLILFKRISPAKPLIFTPFLCTGYAVWQVLCVTGAL